MYITCLVSCKSDNNNDHQKPYDPGKPVLLDRFYPTEGKYQEKTIIEGENFGTDVNLIKVYFNNKSAPVINATGSRIYVMAPRLPGDTCVLSVVIGNDSTAFADPFYYEASTTVVTIAGNGNNTTFIEGELASCQLQPRYLCVDNEDNLFVSVWNSAGDILHVVRINEEENTMTRLQQASVAANIPCVDLETGIVSFVTETTTGSYLTCNPNEYWAPRKREMKWISTTNTPTNGWKHCMVVNPTDGQLYARWYNGQLVKVNPETYEAEVIYTTEQGDSYGLTFSPLEPNILYISFWSNGGTNANSICSIDVTDPANTFKRLSSPSTGGGHRDGLLSVAQFRSPAQIFCDFEGYIYIADYGNHCIRRITPDKMVETVLGVPGTAGWKDGTKEEALFRNPRGIGIGKDGTVYVADYGNSRIRKLSVN